MRTVPVKSPEQQALAMLFRTRELLLTQKRCLKAFGERIMARDPDRQTAEIHIRIALMNRFTALGTAEIIRVA